MSLGIRSQMRHLGDLCDSLRGFRAPSKGEGCVLPKRLIVPRHSSKESRGTGEPGKRGRMRFEVDTCQVPAALQAKRAVAHGDRKGLDPSISVVIASFGRREVLHETIESLLSQSLLPSEIIVSVPGIEHVDAKTLALPRVRLVISERGSCHQRNAAVRALSGACRYVAFFDDDVELDAEYLRTMYRALEANGDVVVATGNVVRDGAKIGGVCREAARNALRVADSGAGAELDIRDVFSGYGCNMMCPAWIASELPFDERLPLYGWLEDTDFSIRARQFGRIVQVSGSRCVHMAQPSGRVSGYRFGFSQVVNPCYLMRKHGRAGVTPAALIRQYLLPVIAKNALFAFDRVRRERLVGNLNGLACLMTRGAVPERVTMIS